MDDIRRARRGLKISQTTAGQALGVSRQAIGEAEAGQRGPTQHGLRLLVIAWPHLSDDERAAVLAEITESNGGQAESEPNNDDPT